jgi:hypothetical protein
MTDNHTPASRPPPWREFYQGGSPEAEWEHFRQLASAIVDVQRDNQQNSGRPALRRTFHAKIVVGVDNAELARQPQPGPPPGLRRQRPQLAGQYGQACPSRGSRPVAARDQLIVKRPKCAASHRDGANH